MSAPVYDASEWKPGSFTVAQNGCWIWSRSINRDGYGVIKISGREWRAHRASYEHHVGPIPDGLVIDHLCRMRACVNPEHLEPVTDEENRARGFGAAAQVARTGRCVNGHPYIDANTYRRKEGRACRACARERMAAKARDQRGLTFICPVCGEERHANGKRRHLSIHGVAA